MSRSALVARNLFLFLLVVAVLIPFASASGPYVKGSSNTVTADPNVTRPSTTPCVVTLFTDMGFDTTNYSLNPYSYAPPADCPGPWAKVVFEADIDVTEGIQYDRTINIWLGPTNLFFGTTAQPGPTLSPSWHVESDLTDYSSIFYLPGEGSVFMGNNLCCGLTGLIYATGTLEFYPLAEGQTAPVTADAVLSLSGGSTGGTAGLSQGSDTLSGTFDFPLNVKEAYLDVYSQGQSSDEFWYSCSPNDVESELENDCGNTGFRETEITIDGQPAGVAPVFPWVFTGANGPYMWYPIPGVQTLNFTPYRVNLTPFAGLLSNGTPHTIAISVYNASSSFSDTASLLVYRDPTTPVITGAVTVNTLAASPTPVVTENLDVQPNYISGTVIVSSHRNFEISGYVETSHGKVTTNVAQAINFVNNQYFFFNAAAYRQNVSQTSTVASHATTSGGGAPTTTTSQNFSFPLTFNEYEFPTTGGDEALTTNVAQNYTATVSTVQDKQTIFTSSLVNTGQHADTLNLNTGASTDQSGSQQYNYWDSTGAAYLCDLADTDNVLKSVSKGCSQ
jgi:hypothetical protein